MSLIDYLQQVPDFRTQPRYPLWVVLVLVIMGVMSGCTGYRALEDFVVRHQAVLLDLMGLPQQRLPSYSTLRRVMVRIDFRVFTHTFNQWAKATFAPQSNEQLATDGKAIKASVKDYDRSYQDFINVVSAFSVAQGVVVGLEVMQNGQQSEIATVQTLLEVLGLQDVCFTLDALHRQKQTIEQIIASGNDYIITVKANQPKLFEHLNQQFEQQVPQSVATDVEQTRDRTTQRTVSVLEAGSDLDPSWIGIQRIVQVERSGTRAGQPYAETMFYISSLPLDAIGFAARIRQHWQIENCLHWPKDVVLAEDAAPLCDGYALVNFAIVRTIAMNLLRQAGFTSITKGIRHIAHDVPRLFSFFQ